jgi:hypothetical protein
MTAPSQTWANAQTRVRTHNRVRINQGLGMNFMIKSRKLKSRQRDDGNGQRTGFTYAAGAEAQAG